MALPYQYGPKDAKHLFNAFPVTGIQNFRFTEERPQTVLGQLGDAEPVQIVKGRKQYSFEFECFSNTYFQLLRAAGPGNTLTDIRDGVWTMIEENAANNVPNTCVWTGVSFMSNEGRQAIDDAANMVTIRGQATGFNAF